MIIISDTSAISSLYQIGMLHLLRDIYGEVIISSGVRRELYEIPEQARAFENEIWLKTISPSDQKIIAKLMNENELDLGESESIALAIELNADHLIIDEKIGRIIARQYGLSIIGLVGVLMKAKRLSLINSVKEQIEKLQGIGFRLHPSLIKRVLDELGEQ